MRKFGRVISIEEKKGFKQYKLILDNSETEESCSIKIQDKDSPPIKDCSKCQGCGLGKKNGGMFVVSGNRVSAINKSGLDIKIGDIVQIEIDKTKIQFQAALSVFFPVVLSMAMASLCYRLFNTEGYAILGMFLGLGLGGVCALFTGAMIKEKILPEII